MFVEVFVEVFVVELQVVDVVDVVFCVGFTVFSPSSKLMHPVNNNITVNTKNLFIMVSASEKTLNFNYKWMVIKKNPIGLLG